MNLLSEKAVINDISEVRDFKALPPEQNPIVLDMLEKSKQFYRLTGIKDTIMFEGPFTVSCFLRGQTQFMIDLMENPGSL